MLLAPAILEVGCLAILTGPIKVFCEKFNIIIDRQKHYNRLTIMGTC